MPLSVSVLIRNRNEGGDLRRVLKRLREQHTPVQEIVVVDNESEDESRSHIEEFGCRLVHLPAGAFTYGRATNLGVEHCAGDLILMLSSHSLPIGRYFIDEVTAPFVNPRVAAVRIPMTTSLDELKNLPAIEPLHQGSSAADVYRRGPVANGSVFRRSVWVRHRFDETLQYAEDKEWALRVLRDGGYIIPVVNTTFCYVRRIDPTSAVWVDRMKRCDLAGVAGGNLYPDASLKALVVSLFAAQREALRKARAATELYWFRRRLQRRRVRAESKLSASASACELGEK